LPRKKRKKTKTRTYLIKLTKRKYLKVRASRKPRVIKIGRHQTGSTTFKRDIKYKALKPGKRISKTGRIYYEYRKNRSDRAGRVK